MNEEKTILDGIISLKQQTKLQIDDKKWQIIKDHLRWVYIAGYEQGRKSVRSGNQKRVRRCADGREFNSVNQAAKSIGVTHTALSKALKNSWECCGSKWRYV